MAHRAKNRLLTADNGRKDLQVPSNRIQATGHLPKAMTKTPQTADNTNLIKKEVRHTGVDKANLKIGLKALG
jgi:hypothetical protein